MTAPVVEAKKIIDAMPQDSSYEEIIKALAFDKMIKSGLEDSKHHRILSNEEMLEKISQW